MTKFFVLPPTNDDYLRYIRNRGVSINKGRMPDPPDLEIRWLIDCVESRLNYEKSHTHDIKHNLFLFRELLKRFQDLNQAKRAAAEFPMVKAHLTDSARSAAKECIGRRGLIKKLRVAQAGTVSEYEEALEILRGLGLKRVSFKVYEYADDEDVS